MTLGTDHGRTLGRSVRADDCAARWMVGVALGLGVRLTSGCADVSSAHSSAAAQVGTSAASGIATSGHGARPPASGGAGADASRGQAGTADHEDGSASSDQAGHAGGSAGRVASAAGDGAAGTPAIAAGQGGTSHSAAGHSAAGRGAAGHGADAGASAAQCAAPLTPVIGAFKNIYDPSAGEPFPWYINDHTVVQGADGSWHMFGITHLEPANPDNETELAHATSPTLAAPNWQKRPSALRVDAARGETVLWAPYVMSHDGTYYMFFCGGGTDRTRFQIELATSTDLAQWTREPEPLFADGWAARDPFVLKVGDRWVLYYTATSQPNGGAHVVAYRTSDDLRHWSERQIAYTDRETGTDAGATESPFVVKRGDDYYLFIGPRDRYNATTVLHSRDPLHFVDPQLTELPAHAAEVVVDSDGQEYLTRAGWGERGLWLAPLKWTESRCERQETPVHRLAIRTEPSSGLSSLRLANPERELLGVSFDVPGPFLLVGDSPQPVKPGPAREVERAPDGSRVAMRGMRMGTQPVEVDWTICATPNGFDHRIVWHVLSNTTVVQAGWSLSVALDTIGDATNADLTGERAQFGQYTWASDATASLAVAYRDQSAFAADSRAYGAGFVAYRNIAQFGGRNWPAGVYQGGQFRVAISGQGHDAALADATRSALAAASNACPL